MSFKLLCELAAAADSLTLHVQKITDNQFMVVIQPSLALAEKYPQLASPLQVIAAPNEMDREVALALTEFTPALQQATSNIREITDALAAATKAAKESGNKVKHTTTTPASTPRTTATAAAPMLKATPPAAISPPDLFNMPVEPVNPPQSENDDDGLPDLED